MKKSNSQYPPPIQRSAWLLLCAAFLSCVAHVAAQTHWHEGSRAGAMGGAFAAVSNDVNALAFTPAGLVYVPQTWMAEFSLQNPFASGVPFRESLRNESALTASSFGVVYNHLHHPNQTRPVLVLGPSHFTAEQTPAAASENVYSLGLAGSVFNSGALNHVALHASFSKGFFAKTEANARTNHFAPRLALSATAKLLGLQYDAHLVQNAEVNSEEERAAIADFFAQHGRSAWGFGMDLGLMAEVHPRAHIALSWHNLLRPDLTLTSAAPLPRAVRGGVALLVQESRLWLVALDYEHSADFPQQRFYFGMESGVLPNQAQTLRVRAGLNRNWMSTGFMLAKPGLVELHYAFLLPTAFSSDRPEGFFQHRFSLSFTKK